MEPRRIFLGWERPALHSAADYLHRQYGSEQQIDLSNVTVVLPGLRAGRRLVEILVEKAESRGLALVPPQTLTLAGLADRLLPGSRPKATALEQKCAWILALKRLKPSEISAPFPTLPESSDTLGWMALAELVARVHRDLAGNDQSFADVPKIAKDMPQFHEEPRWLALETIRQEYLQCLAGSGCADPLEQRREAVDQGPTPCAEQIILLAITDTNANMFRRFLGSIAAQLTILVHAPEDLASHFDPLGFLRVEAWKTRGIPIHSGQIEIGADPSDQAARVARWAEDNLKQSPAEDLVIGVPDPALVPALDQELGELGIRTRHAAGTPIRQTGPLRLLELVANFLEDRHFTDLAALIRHPDLEELLLSGSEGLVSDWPVFLDEYQRKHLQVSLPKRDAHTKERNWVGSPKGARRLEFLLKQLEELLGELVEARSQPLSSWAKPILEFLIAVYGRAPIDPAQGDNHILLEALSRIYQQVQELHELNEELSLTVTSTIALRILLRQVSGQEIPPEPVAESIEMLGWLELPLDDAPELIVTGMNDGRVPESLNAELFLPNALRRRLGLLDNDQRYARDAYALSAILATRPKTRLLSGRRTAEGDPLAPSRLFFACEDHELVGRVEQFFTATPDSAFGGTKVHDLSIPPAPRLTRLYVPKPKEVDIPSYLNVTAFKSYLACPYRFYLRHVLKLQAIDDKAEEMDAAAFGTLAHDVLKAFGKSKITGESNAELVRDFLRSALRQTSSDLFGADPMPAVRLQIKQLERRLDQFADWQARHAAVGWRIKFVEHAVDAQSAPFFVDDQEFYLHGRIDRIDVNEITGEVLVIDYKTSDKAMTPEQTHRQKNGDWIDLQLPLYRHLLKSTGLQGSVQLAYVTLPKRTEDLRLAIADWGAVELEEADDVARRVIRQIRAKQFWPRNEKVPPGFSEFAAICQDDRLVLSSVDLEETEESDRDDSGVFGGAN